MTDVYVSSGVTSSGIVVSDGDRLTIFPGGTVIATVVNPGGRDDVYGVANGTTVSSGGFENVLSGGLATGAVVRSGGAELIAVSGTAVSSVIDDGGAQQVGLYGTASGTVVGSGGADLVLASGTDMGASVQSGGYLIAISGSHIDGVTMSSGGAIISTGVVISQPGSGVTVAGSLATAIAVSGGGTEYVLSLGVAADTTVSSGAFVLVYAGGETEGMHLGNAAYAGLSSGAVGSGTVVVTGGDYNVGGTALSTIVSGGVEEVGPRGTTSGAIVLAGVENVEEGGTASGTVVRGGRQEVGPLSTATGTIVSSGGAQVVTYLATTISTTVSSGGIELAGPGADIHDTIVESGGTLVVLSAATTSGVSVLAGGRIVSTGVVADQPGSGIFVYGSVSSDVSLSDAGTLYVMTGSVARDTTLTGSSTEIVYTGASASLTRIGSGATEVVSSGAETTSTAIDGGTLDITYGGVADGGISFTSVSGTLDIYGDMMPATTISGFTETDTIYLAGVQYDSAGSVSFDSGTDTLTVSAGGSEYDLHLAGDYTGATFSLSSLPVEPEYSGILVHTSLPCFAAGTRIQTERGEIPVENLVVGDLARTVSGMSAPIVWIGSRHVDCSRHPSPKSVWPVLIRAHAFGPGRPTRDMFLSPDHAVYVEEVLVPAKHLINGVTIRQVKLPSVHYFHVELPEHAILLAENLPTESYLDTGDRHAFTNINGPTILHPSFGSERRDISFTMDALGFAPLRVLGPEVERARALLTRHALNVGEPRQMFKAGIPTRLQSAGNSQDSW